MEGPYDGCSRTISVKVALSNKDKKPATMKDYEWEDENQKALSII